MKECNQLVFETVIDFMYGANLPNGLALADAKSLLAMADLYKMEDLKAAVAPLIGKQLDMDNIQEISLLAEKHTALDFANKLLMQRTFFQKFSKSPKTSSSPIGLGPKSSKNINLHSFQSAFFL